jgi:IS30 family transposase
MTVMKLLRNVLLRKTNISKIIQTEIDQISDLYNQRPIKCLGYKTPQRGI